MNKISPKNAVLKGNPLDYMYFPVEGLDEYIVVMRVKNKKGKGWCFRKVKVYKVDIQ